MPVRSALHAESPKDAFPGEKQGETCPECDALMLDAGSSSIEPKKVPATDLTLTWATLSDYKYADDPTSCCSNIMP